jgi:pimeloyl-ACP methyl ester carboxylesterase
MASRRTPEDADEMQRVESSPEFETGDVAAVERYYQLLYFNDREVAPEHGVPAHQNRTRNRDTAKRIFADFGEHALPIKLASITCPTLVVHAERDPVPAASSSAIADAIPQGELAVVRGSNHYGFLESTEAVLGVVEPILGAHAC